MARHLLIVDRRRPRVRQTVWCSPLTPLEYLELAFAKESQTRLAQETPRNSPAWRLRWPFAAQPTSSTRVAKGHRRQLSDAPWFQKQI